MEETKYGKGVRKCMGKFNVINWTENSIESFIKDKGEGRSPHPKELFHLCNFIKDYSLRIIFDLGTWTGLSGYIMATSSPSVEKLISLDWGEIHSINKYGKPKRDVELYGKYLPDGSEYIEADYRKEMDNILKSDKFDFAFIDDGHGLSTVLEQIRICYNNNIRYIAVHDVSTGRLPGKATEIMIHRGYYKEIFKDVKSSPTQGIIFMEINK
jgi:hypothetical protein